MKHTQDEIIVAQEIRTPYGIFRMEEYWEEDDSGFCCVDYILAKHTRLAVLSPDGTTRRKIFDLDSKEYDKSMSLEDDILTVVYYPEVDMEKICRIRIDTLEILR